MHIHSFVYFLSVVDHHSFSEAALDLHISQSSLSKHIQSLEDEFGVKLFNRNKHILSLTEAGDLFAKQAELFVKQYNAIIRSMDDYSESGKFGLKIVSVPVLHLYNLSYLIAEFKKTYPYITLQLVETSYTAIFNEMARQNFDLALVRTTAFPNSSNYTFIPLVEDELAVVCNAKHPMASRESVSIHELNTDSIVLLKPGMFDYEAGLKKLNISFDLSRSNTQLYNVFTIAKYLKEENSRQITLLMGGMADMICADGSLKKIALEEHPPFPLAIAARAGESTKSARTFIDFAKAYYSKNNSTGT
jgi:DNA-binding transcriptional LysR family regulator